MIHLRQCCVYVISNTLNGRVYFGSTIDAFGRWKTHRNVLRRGVHANIHLQRSWTKYGEDNFQFRVLAILEPGELHSTENRILAKFVGKYWCYNISSRADAPNRGRKHSPETIAKMKEKAKARGITQENRAKINETLRSRPKKPKVYKGRGGWKHTPEMRAMFSRQRTGKCMSMETRVKMADSARAAWARRRAAS